ncbi:rRNA maturation RNase YbeY [candidate division KSB1 bacterium]|nr:rRNA maturation RNase YbeY [candidate division KSB1 bacterium]
MIRTTIVFDAKVPELTSTDLKKIIKLILSEHDVTSTDINIIFVDENFIIDLNKRFFYKDYATDVISFPLSDPEESSLEGEVYVCVDVARNQAADYQVSLKNELLRLTIHGVLHLLNYDDLIEDAKKVMSEKEDYYLAKFFDKINPDTNSNFNN